MSERSDALIDILRALGFVLAVVFGGLFIAGFIDGWNAARDDAGTEAEVRERAGPSGD